MGNDFEKMTDNILSDEKGAVPTSIKQLAIALDSFFSRKNEEETSRHEQVMEAIGIHQKNSKENCSLCKLESDKRFKDIDEKFDKIKYVSFLSENPKAAILMIIGIVALLFSGLENIYSKILDWL